jgi:adenylate cyclase
MKVQTYFRICLFVPLIVPIPFLLFKADEGLSSLIVGSLVFGMPPYILFILLPFIYLFGKMSEKQIIIGIIFFPFVYPFIFGLFWSIVPSFIHTVKITLSNPSQWIFTTVVFTAAYSMIFISGYILRKLILKERDIHEQSLAAVLCADIKGYGQHMKEDEAGTLSRLNSCQKEFERYVQEHNGGIVHMAGDSIVAKYESVHDAVDCAISIQQHLKRKNQNILPDKRLLYRIGINLGNVVKVGKDIIGDGVDIAARLERVSEPGSVCITGPVYDTIKNKLLFNYEYLGEMGMTNVVDPLRVYKVFHEESEHSILEPEVELSIQDKPSIAVLPFDNMSRYPEQEYFSNGIAGEILTDLSMLSGLFVISRHSTFIYKGRSVTLQQISKELGVRYILQGNVRKTGDRLSITATLIDVISDKQLWAKKFDQEPNNVFTIQYEILKKIVSTLEINLSEEEQKRFVIHGSENLEAYDLYMSGQEQYFTFAPKNIKKSISTFSQVIELDPDYAMAYAWKSRVLIFQFIIGINNSKEETILPAITLARKAIGIDNLLPLAHACLGWALMWNDEIDEANLELVKSLELDANFADCNMWYSMALSAAGRSEEAIESIRKAIRMNPYHTVQYLFAFGVAYFTQGQYEKAIFYFKRCIELNPNYLPTHIFITSCFGLLEKIEESRAAKIKLLQLDPDCIYTGVSLQYIKLFKRLTDGLIKDDVKPR